MQTRSNQRRDIILVLFSCLGILGLLIRGGYSVVQGILSYRGVSTPILSADLLDAFGILFCMTLLLPMLFLSIRHLAGKQIQAAKIHPIKFWHLALLITAWLVIIIVGTVLESLGSYGWAAAAPFFILGIIIPILTLAWIGIGSLPSGSKRRLWAVYGISMVGSTIAALLLEYLVVGVFLLLFGIAAAFNQQLLTLLNMIKNQITNASSGDIQTLLTNLAPYLTNPLVVLVILVFAAGLAPVIEEAVKPAAIWFLGKRLHSPAEGFLLGALCGAGFATMEGILSASESSQLLAFGLAGRAAASLMHITASGILGWGIASAQLEKRYGRLVLTFLTSISIHGLWNGSVVMAVYGSLRAITQNNQPDLLGIVFVLGGLGVLFLILLTIIIALPLINRRLRHVNMPLSPVNPGGNMSDAPSDFVSRPPD
jgi:RsiW-degrading membrane proteinase PrsW (M82 family)